MRKDRYIFALIIYGVVLLASAGICMFASPGDASAVVNNKDMQGQNVVTGAAEITTQPEAPSPTSVIPQPIVPNPNAGEEQGNAGGSGSVSQEDAWKHLSVETTPEWRAVIGERCIVIPKPEQAFPEQEIIFSLSEMPVDRSIALEFHGCTYTEYAYTEFERISDGQYFNTEPVEESADPLKEVKQFCVLQTDGSYHYYIELLLDKTYAYNVYEAEEYYFISLADAKKVYDRIVVLDAGHGGWDTGTSSHDGQYLEKDINLQVLLYLEELLTAEGIKVYTTRTTDRNVGHSERIYLANALEADLFISIHCNNAYQNPDANGTEVLYTQYQNSEMQMNSKKLAQICLEELVAELQLKDRGLVARGDDLTVLQQAEVPAVIVELAFMSNTADMETLKKDETQTAAAKALYKAVLRAYDALEAE